MLEREESGTTARSSHPSVLTLFSPLQSDVGTKLVVKVQQLDGKSNSWFHKPLSSFPRNLMVAELKVR
jgi:hypothetical protein